MPFRQMCAQSVFACGKSSSQEIALSSFGFASVSWRMRGQLAACMLPDAPVASASDGPSTSSHHGRTPVFFFGSVKLPSDLPHFAYCTGTCEQPAERAATYWNIGSRRQRSSHLNFDQDARPRHLRLHRGTHRLIIRIHPIVPYLRILHTKNESSDASAQHSCTAKTYSVHSLEIGGNVLQPDGRI